MIAAEFLNILADKLSSKLTGNDLPVTSVSIDTRTIQPGQLFVALQGPNFDGHNYTATAMEKGAAAVLVSRDVDEAPRIKVEDTEQALTRIGYLNRDTYERMIVGVTGSSGKTSVKEMLASIFRQVGSTLATQGNLNNGLGVPVTLSRLTSEHEYAVIEMGTNSPGEIAHLAKMVRPKVALITNASTSHVAGLGGLMGVVEEKGSIFDNLPADGCAVINRDDAHYQTWVDRVQENTDSRIMTFSLDNPEATCWPSDIVTDDDGMHFTLHLSGQQTPVHLQFWGRHQIANACAAATVASAAGLDIEMIAAGLGEARPYARRGQRFRTANGALVIDESYNANLDSTRAAVDELVDCDGYRILIVGDLSEEHFLNETDGINLHREIGSYARSAGVDRVLTFGRWSHHIHSGFAGEGQHFEDKQELCNWLLPHLNAGVAVLVKGSMSTGMNDIVNACLAEVSAENSTKNTGEVA